MLQLYTITGSDFAEGARAGFRTIMQRVMHWVLNDIRFVIEVFRRWVCSLPSLVRFALLCFALLCYGHVGKLTIHREAFAAFCCTWRVLHAPSAPCRCCTRSQMLCSASAVNVGFDFRSLLTCAEMNPIGSRHIQHIGVCWSPTRNTVHGSGKITTEIDTVIPVPNPPRRRIASQVDYESTI